MAFVGEGAAIGAAVVWAMATWIYSQFSHQFSALQMNIIKGVIASLMMLLVMPTLSYDAKPLSDTHFLILAVSGIIGIAVGDSAYFASLKRIGPNKTLLLESLAPPLSGVMAMVALGSVLSLQSWFGVVITTVAVTMVVFQPSSADRTSWSGVGFGLLASICQATGVVISHYALVAGDIEPILGALIRLSVGVLAVMLTIGLFETSPYRTISHHLKSLTKHSFAWLLGAIFVGTFLALWLQQIALKHANPAVAQTLIASSPLFMLVIMLVKREPISRRSLVGTFAALGGISLFFL